MTLRQRIILMAAMPIVGLMAFAGWGIYRAISDIRAVTVSERELDLAEHVSDVVHNLQAERGMSAGFIASGGEAFVTELPAQRGVVDAAVMRLHADGASLDAAGHAGYDAFVDDLELIATHRRKVDALEVSASEMAAAYTATIRKGLRILEDAISNVQTAQVVRVASGVVAISEAKESAGVERAMGATGFGSGGFRAPILRAYIARAAAQDTALQQAAIFLEEQSRGVGFLQAPQLQDVMALRKIAYDAAESGDLQGVTASQWFSASTAWIEHLRVEQLAYIDIMHDTDAAILRQAVLVLVLIITLSLGAVLFSASYARQVIRSMTRQLSGLRRSFDHLARKELDFVVPNQDDPTEIGELNRALESTRANLLDIETRQQAERGQRAVVVEHLGNALERLANQDLTCHISDPFQAQYEALRENFNAAVARLAGVLGDVEGSVGGLQGNVDTLSTSSERLAQRTENQAATLEQTSAAINQISDTASDIASHAQQAANAVKDASQEAGTGGATAQQALEAMQRIAQSSREMTEIVDLIEELGFQTNLLALNAGVEAARAGEAGRGFAVVASEVRMLAQRATSATDRIKKLIDASTEQVATGVTLVERTDAVLGSIVGKVSHVNEMVDKIRHDSQDQASTMGEINTAAQSMAEITEKNAAMVDETRRLCRELLGHGNALTTQIQGFNLRAQHRGDSAPHVDQAAGWG